MQIEPRKKKIRIEELATEINSKFHEAIRLKTEAQSISNAAVVVAVEVGRMLAQVRAMVPHGDWMKWLEDECPDIGYTTANSWIKIGSNSRILENLGTLKSLTEAYQIVGILPPKEDSKQIQATGTASVSIADSFANRFSKHCHRIVEHSTLIDFSSLGEPAKERLVSSIDELLKIREALTV